MSVSKGSAGYVAARGNVSGDLYDTDSGSNGDWDFGASRPGSIMGILSGTISGGTTDLTTRQYSAKLVNATTLSCDGPVEWQVIEYT